MQRRVISVVVLAREAATTLPEVVARVRAQTVSGVVEVVVVDSGGADAGMPLADRVVRAPKKSTLAECWNAGLLAARGEVAVLLDGRALPADPRWLFHLCAPLADPRVAAVFAQRLPAPGFMVRAEPPGPRLDRFAPDAEQERAAVFEPACTALSRAAWEARAFDPHDDGRRWARAALRSGLTLVHSSAAVVSVQVSPRPWALLAAAVRARVETRLGHLP